MKKQCAEKALLAEVQNRLGDISQISMSDARMLRVTLIGLYDYIVRCKKPLKRITLMRAVTVILMVIREMDMKAKPCCGGSDCSGSKRSLQYFEQYRGYDGFGRCTECAHMWTASYESPCAECDGTRWEPAVSIGQEGAECR